MAITQIAVSAFDFLERLGKNNDRAWFAANKAGYQLGPGYEDYQHLVKDFKAFAGQQPQALLEAQANSPEHSLKAID